MPTPDRLRAAPVPVRPARPVQAARRAIRGWAGRPLDRHAVRSAAAGGDRRPRRLRRRTWVPAEHRLARPARGGRGVDRAALRRRRPGRPHRRLHRHQGVRRDAAAVAAPAPPRPRHGALPGDRLPDLRDGGDPGRLPAGPGAARRRPVGSTSTRSIPTDAERALVLWVNSPSNPTGALDDLAAAAAWGRAHDVPVFSDECYVEFTWGGRGPHDPRARPRRCRRRALAVEALEPGRRPGRLLRRRRRARRSTSKRCASTSG